MKMHIVLVDSRWCLYVDRRARGIVRPLARTQDFRSIYEWGQRLYWGESGINRRALVQQGLIETVQRGAKIA